MIDIEAFEERAAIMEFDGGLSRFRAETLAAAAQGKRRDEVMNEIRRRDSERARHRAGALARQQRADDLPGVQPAPQEEARPVSERHEDGGRDPLGVLALRLEGGREVR